MPQPVFRGIHLLLDGRVSKKSKIFFFADNVVANAEIKITGRSASGTQYKWSGLVGKNPNGKPRMIVNCELGDTRTIRRGRKRGRGHGAGDVIDVTFTITNPSSAPVDSPEIVGIE